MQAIFESRGLNNNNSARIFVPSKIKDDGLKLINKKKVISLYSSEFSQRLMLSLIKPKTYLLDQYKNSNNLETIAKILTMQDIAIISAPALSILKWANLALLRKGLKKSILNLPKEQNPELLNLLKTINNKGIESASIEIQKALSNAFSDANIIFSVSSLINNQWASIRKFMKWKKGHEKSPVFTFQVKQVHLQLQLIKDPLNILQK